MLLGGVSSEVELDIYLVLPALGERSDVPYGYFFNLFESVGVGGRAAFPEGSGNRVIGDLIGTV